MRALRSVDGLLVDAAPCSFYHPVAAFEVKVEEIGLAGAELLLESSPQGFARPEQQHLDVNSGQRERGGGLGGREALDVAQEKNEPLLLVEVTYGFLEKSSELAARCRTLGIGAWVFHSSGSGSEMGRWLAIVGHTPSRIERCEDDPGSSLLAAPGVV